MNTFAPVLNVLARIMVGYSLMFLVPLGWAWTLDHALLRDVWLIGMAITFCAGALLWLATARQRRELLPRDGWKEPWF